MKGFGKDCEDGQARWPRSVAALLDGLESLGLCPSGLARSGDSRGHLLAGALIFLGVSAVIGGFLWPYVFNSWLVRLGREPWWRYWHGFVFGAVPFVGQTAFLAALVTWLCLLLL